MDTYFNRVYCINLKRCEDRKNHMINEFKKIGLNKYEFVEAIDKNDYLVSSMMASGKVMKYPPCFRCKKMMCYHKSKYLTTSQIGNWLSHKKVWQDIVRNKVLWSLICEDDLVFTPYLDKVVNQVLTENGLKKYGLRKHSATLLRLGWRKSSEHVFVGKIRVNRRVKMSNPCYAITYEMAKKLIAHMNIIDTTSDEFIHNRVATRYNHYTLLPPIAYELSFGNNPQFRSEIIPKEKFIKKLRKDLNNEGNLEKKKLIQNKIEEETKYYQNEIRKITRMKRVKKINTEVKKINTEVKKDKEVRGKEVKGKKKRVKKLRKSYKIRPIKILAKRKLSKVF